MYGTPSDIRTIPIDRLRPNPDNPRVNCDSGALTDLRDSIMAHGVLQPIVVRPSDCLDSDGPSYMIVCGHRRYAAAIEAGMREIPAVVQVLDDDQAAAVALVENLQREDLSPIDEAKGYKQLLDAGKPIPEIAVLVNRSAGQVASRLALAELPGMTLDAFEHGEITLSVANEIARLSGQNQMIEATQLVQRHANRDWVDDEYGSSVEIIYPCSLQKARALIRAAFLLNLENAPFDVNNPELVEGAGSCASCGRRTGNRTDLFGDLVAEAGGADICTYAPCYESKTEAHADALLATAKEQGMAIVPASKAVKIWSGGQVMWNAPYVECDAAYVSPEGLRGKKSWEAKLGKKAPQVYAAVSPAGNLVRLYLKREAVAALDEKAKQAKQHAPTDQTKARGLDEYQLRMEAKQKALDSICGTISAQHGALEPLLSIVAEQLLHQHIDIWGDEILVRRNIPDEDGAVETHLDSLGESGLRGLILEVALFDLATRAANGMMSDAQASAWHQVEGVCGFSTTVEMRAAREAVEKDEAGNSQTGGIES